MSQFLAELHVLLSKLTFYFLVPLTAEPEAATMKLDLFKDLLFSTAGTGH